MKKFLIIFGYSVLTLLAVLYLAFLFVLPRAIDLNTFKPEIQKLAKQYANLNIDFDNLRISTTPLLSAGIVLDGLDVKLSDNSTVFSAENIKGRVALPALLLLQVKVSTAEVNSPVVNLDIENGEEFKLVKLVEYIINTNKPTPEEAEAKKLAELAAAESQKKQFFTFNPNWIKKYVPNVLITDYQVRINDLKSSHYLALKGDVLRAGYYNGKIAKVKTNAVLMSDDKSNILANIDINTFIPPAIPKDEEDEDAQEIDIPFVNPVLMYRNYDLQSEIDAKLRVRNHKGHVRIFGHLNIDNTTLKLSDLQLPKGHLNTKFYGNKLITDTNFFVAPQQNILLNGKLNFGKHPAMDMKIWTEKIFFNDLVVLSKAILDSLHIKNDFDSLKGSGYFFARGNIKTNFKKFNSQGQVVIKDGSILNDKIGLLFKKINLNLMLDNNSLRLVDTQMNINDGILQMSGVIDKNAVADIVINSKALPLPGLYSAFAPLNLKKSVSMDSGTASLDAKINGKLNRITSEIKLGLSNLKLTEKASKIVVSDELGNIDISIDLDKSKKYNSKVQAFVGKLTNKNFKIYIPQTTSLVAVPNLTVDMDTQNIFIRPFDININSASKINVKGQISEYSKNLLMSLFADGKLLTSDLKHLVGPQAAYYLDSNGTIPLKVFFSGNSKKQNITCQIASDMKNYITFADIQSMVGKQGIIQANIDFKGNRFTIKDTGLFVKSVSSEFGNDFEANMANTQEIATISGTVASVAGEPFINLIKVNIPHELTASICKFKRSMLYLSGKMFVFGKVSEPKIRGHLALRDSFIADLYTEIKNARLNFNGTNLNLNVKDLLLNGSDIAVNANASLLPASVFTVNKVDVNSKNFDLDKVMKIADVAMKFVPPALPSVNTNSAPADIPVKIEDGSILFRQLKTGDIIATNTTGNIALNKNVFFLNNLRTHVFDGIVRGNISANLQNMGLGIQVKGNGLNVEKALLILAGMKDTLSGEASFDTDLTLVGVTLEEQMKSLKGNVNFDLVDGSLGPIGKIENMILSENIRNSQFFQTALGSIINSAATIDTAHFDSLKGHLSFEDGVVDINPIVSLGKVMSLHIAGNMDLLANTCDMKVRGKLASTVSDLLGPLSNLNPVNLIKNTPGLNVLAAQAFRLFSETITQEEMLAIPSLEDADDNATKMQIVLRGDVAKPLSLFKSFKWLVVEEEMAQALAFVSTLKAPVDEETGMLLKVDEAGNVYKVENPDATIFDKLKYKLKGLKSDKKENIEDEIDSEMMVIPQDFESVDSSVN